MLYEFVTKERNFLTENVHAQRELERLRRARDRAEHERQWRERHAK